MSLNEMSLNDLAQHRLIVDNLLLNKLANLLIGVFIRIICAFYNGVCAVSRPRNILVLIGKLVSTLTIPTAQIPLNRTLPQSFVVPVRLTPSPSQHDDSRNIAQ